MPIRIAHYPDLKTPLGTGGTAPVFVCDACGEPIADARLGLYLMHRDADLRPYSDIVYAHSGPCLEKLHSPEGYDWADNLENFATMLLNNTKLGHLLNPNHRA